MKKIAMFLLGMLTLTGALYLAGLRISRTENRLYRQEDVGAGQAAKRLPEQVISKTNEKLREEQKDCYAFGKLTEEEKEVYL